MNLMLNLPPETEAKLKEQAIAQGKALEAVALAALNENLAANSEEATTLAPDDWLREFDAWVAAQHSRNPHVDDSREAIYSDGK